MSEKHGLFSVTSSADGDEVTVHLDLEGLDGLIADLQKLRELTKDGNCEHLHLMSVSWGLGDLTETMLAQESADDHSQVHHVIVYTWSEEWRKKHGL